MELLGVLDKGYVNRRAILPYGFTVEEVERYIGALELGWESIVRFLRAVHDSYELAKTDDENRAGCCSTCPRKRCEESFPFPLSGSSVASLGMA